MAKAKVNAGDLTTREMREIYSSLVEDINLACPNWNFGKKNAQIPFHGNLAQNQRRSLVRALFAFIEGTSYTLRQKVLSRNRTNLSPSVLLALDEKQLEVCGNGEVGLKTMKVSMMNLLKLTIKQFVISVPACGAIECRGVNFEGLVSSVKTRDRLMHPRSVADLCVTDEEINKAIYGAIWYEKAFVQMLTGLITMLEEEVAVLQQKKEALAKEVGAVEKRRKSAAG